MYNDLANCTVLNLITVTNTSENNLKDLFSSWSERFQSIVSSLEWFEPQLHDGASMTSLQPASRGE